MIIQELSGASPQWLRSSNEYGYVYIRQSIGVKRIRDSKIVLVALKGSTSHSLHVLLGTNEDPFHTVVHILWYISSKKAQMISFKILGLNDFIQILGLMATKGVRWRSLMTARHFPDLVFRIRPLRAFANPTRSNGHKPSSDLRTKT